MASKIDRKIQETQIKLALLENDFNALGQLDDFLKAEITDEHNLTTCVDYVINSDYNTELNLADILEVLKKNNIDPKEVKLQACGYDGYLEVTYERPYTEEEIENIVSKRRQDSIRTWTVRRASLSADIGKLKDKMGAFVVEKERHDAHISELRRIHGK